MNLARPRPGKCIRCTSRAPPLGLSVLIAGPAKRWVHPFAPIAHYLAKRTRESKANPAPHQYFKPKLRHDHSSKKTPKFEYEKVKILSLGEKTRNFRQSASTTRVGEAIQYASVFHPVKRVKLPLLSHNALSDLIWEKQQLLVNSLSADDLALWRIDSEESFKKWRKSVQDRIKKACTTTEGDTGTRGPVDPLFHRFKAAFIKSGPTGLTNELKYLFQKMALETDRVSYNALRSVANLSHPAEWFPGTRQIQRKIHLHVGPTNSGKTYQALKKLEEAETGFYAGPLRLLAQEVYTRMNAKGKLCSLITGEERKVAEGQTSIMSACTVEMLPLNTLVDVAVIDEIQMLAHPDRGWAWTNAFLGVHAKEIHLCGELRAVSLVQQLCKLTGETLEIHNYERLTPLEPMKTSLKGSLTNLRRGDCIIAFSRDSLHALKKQVEVATGRRCAIVYGSLPPETRTQQSALFNDPHNDYDFLVASDAVGMGLNLSIKRIIFHETQKFDGDMVRTIATSELKQIGGRAGRFTTAVQDNAANGKDRSSETVQSASGSSVGLVTTFDEIDLPVVTKAMGSDATPLTAAAIMPTDDDIVRFASYYPLRTPMSFILQRMAELSSTTSTFFFTTMREVLDVAEEIQTVNMTLRDRLRFLPAPASIRETGGIVRVFADCVGSQKSGNILEIPEVHLDALDVPISDSKRDLEKLEGLHKTMTLYLWLSFRFPNVFTSQALVSHISSLCEEKIKAFLSHVTIAGKEMTAVRSLRRVSARENEQALLMTDKVPQARGNAVEEKDGRQATLLVLPVNWKTNHHPRPTWANPQSTQV